MNTTRIHAVGALLSGLLGLLTAPPAPAVTLIPGGENRVTAMLGNGPSRIANLTALPALGSLSAVSTLGERSNVRYDLDTDGFVFDFDHVRPAAGSGVGGESARLLVFVDFEVNTQMQYFMSGAYSAVDPTGGELQLYAFLVDQTNNVMRYRSRQRSTSTPNESFVLGGLGGDSNNLLEGSSSGCWRPARTTECTWTSVSKRASRPRALPRPRATSRCFLRRFPSPPPPLCSPPAS